MVDEHRCDGRDAEAGHRGIAGIGGGRAETRDEAHAEAGAERAADAQQRDRADDGGDREPEDRASGE